MKPLTIYLILLFFSCSAEGQVNTDYGSGPQYLNHIYYYRGDSLVELQQTSGKMVSKTKAMGYGGSEGGLLVQGEKSSVRIKGGDSVRFAIKTGMSMMMDPSMMIRLYKFSPKKGDREAVLSSEGGMYNRDKSTTNAAEIPFNIQKGTDDYIIIPASRLAPGEYGFMNLMMVNGAGSRNMSYAVFVFGVD